MKPTENDPPEPVQMASLTSANGVTKGEEFVVRSGAAKSKAGSEVPSRTTSQSGDDWSASLSEEEDYDQQAPDMKAMIERSEGGGLKSTMTNGVKAGVMIPQASKSEQVLYESNKSIEASKPKPSLGGRRRSIQVTLEKTDRKGKYILTADDPEYREIMRTLIERQEAEATKAKRPRFRDLVFTRRFTTFDRQNPLSHDSPFYGFFTLFWMGVGFLLVRIAAFNWREHGSILGEAPMFRMMFERDVLVLGMTDGVMCAATLFGYFLQKLIVAGYLSWSRTGWIVQNLWQCLYLFTCLWWTWFRKWPWTHTVFIVLHCIVFLMKQHSYAFYNGYLSQVSRRRRILQEKLRQLEETEPSASPKTPEMPFSTARDSPQLSRSQSKRARNRRRTLSNAKSKASTNLSKDTSEIATIAKAIDSGLSLDEQQLAAFSDIVRNEITALTEELRGKSTNAENSYPNNLTIANWADWTCLPTLVYELEYPRQESRSWLYIAEKSIATLGCIWVMMVVSQAYIYPLVMETVRMKNSGMTLEERWKEYPWILADMLFPLLLEQLLTWYVIWECLLNVLAELTLFADRGFYGDWWNSVSFDQYARDWNRPVHNFLLRHVYHSSISSFKLSKGTATFVTFLLSALVHELVMLCIFKKLRGYLFFMQLCQIPLTALSRTKLLKGRNTLGNALFWFALFVGPAIIMSLYLIV